jgi:TolB-like protein/Tfp pilus assembly protein PilF
MRCPDNDSDSGFNTTAVLAEPCLVFAPGAIFAGRYQIIEELGRGPLGRTYKVFDTGTQEILCLKLVSPEATADRDIVESIQQELREVCRIEHPNICRIFHFGRHNGTFYLTRSYIAGQNLEHMLRMLKQLNPQTALSIAKQICRGLIEAHGRGITHGDLRAGSIMLDRHGGVQVKGFGLEHRLGSSGLSVDVSGSMSGRADADPEDCGEAAGADAALFPDIRALGGLLHEMVTGGGIPLDGPECSPHMPSRLQRVILRCMSATEDGAYRNVSELLADLDAVEQNLFEPVQLERKPQNPAAGQGSRRSWLRVGFLTPLIVILAFSARFLFLNRGEAAVPSSYPARKMLAVLPFENLGPHEDDYFAAGLTEELSARLSCLRELGVISRQSARYYKDTEKTPRQIHEELGVDYILDGTVQWVRSGGEQDRVRVTAQLIRAADDTPLWSELNNLVLEDIFEVQSRIAEDVASKLDLTVLEPERDALSAEPTDNLEAYDLYLQAGFTAGSAWNQVDLGLFEQAVGLLNQAIRLDPEFIMAHITLALTHQWMYVTGIDRTTERLDLAWQALEGAKRLDAEFPEVMLAEGLLHYRAYQDYDSALKIFQEVKRVRPNLPYTYLGYIQRRQGKWNKSLENLERAFTFNPRSADLAFQIGTSYLHLRRYEEALEWCNRSIAIDPQYYFPYLAKVRVALLSRGDIEEARRISRTIPEHQYSDYLRFLLCMLERDYNAAFDLLSASRFDEFVGQDFYMPKSLLMAGLMPFLGDEEASRVHAEAARDTLVAGLERTPEDPRQRLSLGLALALLGDEKEAVRQGEAAVEAVPLERDAFTAPRYALGLAGIYVSVGRVEDTVRVLDRLLSIPAGNVLSVAWLKVDPSWDAIREHPLFQRMVRKHERESTGDGSP